MFCIPLVHLMRIVVAWICTSDWPEFKQATARAKKNLLDKTRSNEFLCEIHYLARIILVSYLLGIKQQKHRKQFLPFHFIRNLAT